MTATLDGGRPRELRPIILGHGKGPEVALIYQFAGRSRSGLPPGGGWKCDVRLREGPWHTGPGHSRPQSCVDIVDLDANPSSRPTTHAATQP